VDAFKKLLPVLPLVLLFGAAFQSSNSVPEQLKAIQSQLSSLKPRQFYLTRTEHDGAHALSACATGYHMASLYEILDPSNLRYNKELGQTDADSGFGPPHLLFGWIRGSSSIPPLTNCSSWTNASGMERGNAVSLHGYFDSNPVTQVSPWFAFTFECSSEQRAWCVQD
jgi:hypothetical protein